MRLASHISTLPGLEKRILSQVGGRNWSNVMLKMSDSQAEKDYGEWTECEQQNWIHPGT